MPEFYMIYARKINKMPKFYMIIAQKIFFPSCPCPPVSYAYGGQTDKTGFMQYVAR